MRRVVVAALAAVLLTGCAPGTDGIPGVGRVDVDLDTAQLRALKQDAAIEPCVSPVAEPAAEGLPEVELACLGGGPEVDAARLRGPLVVSLFASWCGPCKEEMPVLADFHDRHGDDVPVLGIDWKDVNPDAALELARDAGATYPLVADPNADLGEAGLRVIGMPTLILIDDDGDIAWQQGIVIKSRAQLEELVGEHLGVDL